MIIEKINEKFFRINKRYRKNFQKIGKIFLKFLKNRPLLLYMLVSKKYLNIVGASLMQGLLLANPDPNGPLVQRDDNNKICVNPIMSPVLVDDLHQLMKRSYRITNRGDNEFDYQHPGKLIRNRSNRMSHASFSPYKLIRESFTNSWLVHKPFIGTHGMTSLDGLPGKVVPGSMEVDYQGFVAYLAPERGRPPVVAIVYRGSQSKSFQKFHGILGPSWLTNFSAKRMEFPMQTMIPGYPTIDNIQGTSFHKGFLKKYLSGRFSVLADIDDIWNTIPEKLRSETRFIITGHSQGAGVAIPAALDIVNTLGKCFFGKHFDNVKTPRFFVYALSGPNPVGDVATKNVINNIVGRDNIIRHNSIFDLVTYACLGERYNQWLCNFIFGTIAGVEAGYHPVGHLAIDDVKQLFEKGLRYNKKEDILANIDNIWDTWRKFYSEAIERRQSDSYIRSFYLAISQCLVGAHGVNQMDGIYSFICINHYGSTTANIDCLPIETPRKIRLSKVRSEMFDPVALRNLIESKQFSCSDYHPESENNPAEEHGASFDPRLPECTLTPCLIRGENHRNLIKVFVAFEDPLQVFDPDLDIPVDIILTEYDSEEYDSEEYDSEEYDPEEYDPEEYDPTGSDSEKDIDFHAIGG